MEEIFVKEWVSKQLRQVFHVYPLASNVEIEVIDLKHPDLERYMHLMENKWSLKVATSAYSCTHEDIRGITGKHISSAKKRVFCLNCGRRMMK